MDAEKVRQICEGYEKLVRARAYERYGKTVPTRLSEGFSTNFAMDIPLLARCEHLLFMAQEIPKLMDAGRVEKAMRWLGWLQGACWAAGLESLHDAKMRNAPEGAEYSRDA